MPMEHYARLLALYTQADPALPPPAPANDDHQWPSFADDMFDRIGSISGRHREAQPIRLDPPPAPAAEAAYIHDLGELVAIALTSVQDAQEVSRAAKAASRIARRGALVAMGLAAVGIAIAGTAALDARVHRAANRSVAETTGPAQSPGNVQHPAAAAQLAAQPARQPVMEATAVRILPAEPAAPQAGGDQPASSPPAYTGRVRERSWTPYRRPVRHYRGVVPRPVMYFFSTAQ
jgi:hypothetical protein